MYQCFIGAIKKQKPIFSGSKSAVWTGKTMQESKFQLKS